MSSRISLAAFHPQGNQVWRLLAGAESGLPHLAGEWEEKEETGELATTEAFRMSAVSDQTGAEGVREREDENTEDCSFQRASCPVSSTFPFSRCLLAGTLETIDGAACNSGTGLKTGGRGGSGGRGRLGG